MQPTQKSSEGTPHTPTNTTFRFKQMAQATHPQTHPNDLIVNTVQFREICEAFDILSNGKFQLRVIL